MNSDHNRCTDIVLPYAVVQNSTSKPYLPLEGVIKNTQGQIFAIFQTIWRVIGGMFSKDKYNIYHPGIPTCLDELHDDQYCRRRLHLCK